MCPSSLLIQTGCKQNGVCILGVAFATYVQNVITSVMQHGQAPYKTLLCIPCIVGDED